MRADRVSHVILRVLTGVLAACLGPSVAAATSITVSSPAVTPTPCADIYRSASGNCLTLILYREVTFVPSLGQPMYTPNATELADGYLSVAAYPDPSGRPLTVVVLPSYVGPYGVGPCGLGPWVFKYEFGDGTETLIPVPSCAAAALRTPEPSPTGVAQHSDRAVQHTYTQPGAYRVRVSGGYVNNHGIMAETTVVVSAPPPPPATSGGEIDPRTLVLVLAGGGVGLLLLVGLAFAIAARERAWQNGEG